MKKTVLVMILGLVALFAQAKQTSQSVSMRNGRNDVVYFKVKKCLLGSKMEVLNNQQQVVATKILTTRKNMIVFLDQKPGDYIIRITRESEVIEIPYVNHKNISDSN